MDDEPPVSLQPREFAEATSAALLADLSQLEPGESFDSETVIEDAATIIKDHIRDYDMCQNRSLIWTACVRLYSADDTYDIVWDRISRAHDMRAPIELETETMPPLRVSACIGALNTLVDLFEIDGDGSPLGYVDDDRGQLLWFAWRDIVSYSENPHLTMCADLRINFGAADTICATARVMREMWLAAGARHARGTYKRFDARDFLNMVADLLGMQIENLVSAVNIYLSDSPIDPSWTDADFMRIYG